MSVSDVSHDQKERNISPAPATITSSKHKQAQLRGLRSLVSASQIDEGKTHLEPHQGPAHSQPMPLQIAQGSEKVDQPVLQGYSGSVTQGKQAQLQCSE